MRILISGGSGFVGGELIKKLTPQHEFVNLSRSSARGLFWDPGAGVVDRLKLAGFDAAIHLAGESVASGLWTKKKRAAIRESRIKSTILLASALAEIPTPPKVLISASAVGYYGNRGSDVLTEISEHGSGFLADLAVEWENATKIAHDRGIRVVNLRIGIVLGRGGALAAMLPVFKLALGGRLGSGQQFMSWIALDDLIEIVRFSLTEERVVGAVNCVAPNPVTNAEFTDVLAETIRRPAFIPLPTFVLKTLLGQMAEEILLSSTRVMPQKIIDLGFKFRFPIINDALKEYT